MQSMLPWKDEPGTPNEVSQLAAWLAQHEETSDWSVVESTEELPDTNNGPIQAVLVCSTSRLPHTQVVVTKPPQQRRAPPCRS